MLRNYKLIVLITLLVLLVASPMASFAQGSGKFKVARTLHVAGTEIQAGTYDVKYEVSGSDATVMFTVRGKVEVQVKGKVEDGGRVSDYNSLSLGKDAAGREAIKALMFKGSKDIVVFD